MQYVKEMIVVMKSDSLLVDMALSVLDGEAKCALEITKIRDHELPVPVIIDNCSAKNAEVSRYGR